jgi:hypothetical protein
MAVFRTGGLQNIKLAAGLVASLGPSYHAVQQGPHDFVVLGSRGPNAPCAFSPLRPPLPTTPAPPRSPQPVCIGFVSFFLIVLFVLEPVTLCSFLSDFSRR